MDDFYVYYKTSDEHPDVGDIMAVSPAERSLELEHVRVPADIGRQFTLGTEPLHRWGVFWDAATQKMTFARRDDHKKTEESGPSRVFAQIPRGSEDSEICITWDATKKTFAVKSYGISIDHPNVTMWFFVTAKDDPNIVYFKFEADLLETMSRKGKVVDCDAALPEEFGVHTRQLFNSYRLSVEG